jgi:FkbM family methyltransferase
MLTDIIDNVALRLRFEVWAKLRAGRHASFDLSHSQFGEDMIVRTLCASIERGIYVDIGAHHPVYFSNTYYFYRRGWRGLNVDANPGTKRLFDVLRPRDVNVEACVGADAGQTVEFFVFDQPALNTTDPEMARRAQELTGARLLSRRSFQTHTLAELVERHLPGARVDVLNIDIEGLDEQVLLHHDWTRLRPRVLIFERHGLDPLAAGDDVVIRRLREVGYAVRGIAGPSWILSLQDAEPRA